MKKKLLFIAIGLLMTCAVSAQLYITNETLNFNSVTNDGIAVGSPGQNQPFYLWNPFSGEYTLIGGVSAGNGVGGVARFSDDGKMLAASMHSDTLQVNTQWVKAQYPELNYKITKIHYVSDYNLYAVGTSDDDQSGVILLSANNGISWKRHDYVQGATATNYLPEAGLTAISSLGYVQIIAGGHQGKLYVSSGNGSWTSVNVRPEGESREVKTYWAIDFIPHENNMNATYGCIGVEYTDGSYGVWYTIDSGETFLNSDGVMGVPVDITHIGNTFFMVTKNGKIESSIDNGKTWTELFATSKGESFSRIRFADAEKGIALSEGLAYITYDGGETWQKTDILPSISPFAGGSKILWNDVAWSDTVITVVGTLGQIFQSTDNGKVFKPLRIDLENKSDYGAIFYDRSVYNIMSENGVFYRKSDIATIEGYCAGLYNMENQTWTPLGTSGYDMQAVASSPWNISGDGKTVVGLAYYFSKVVNKVQAHASVWNEQGVITDLGSKFEDRNRATRANAVSHDGSVIVGWQDIYGPWYASVWRKKDDGNYAQSLLLKDNSMTEEDIDFNNYTDMQSNLLGYCQSVTADGQWIGGHGNAQSAVPGPWIWNRDAGVIQLSENEGCVADIFNDGTKVVGWLGRGTGAWIWEKDKGIMSLQDYATNVLGCELGDFVIHSVYDMSPNGRYLTGYGMEGNSVYGYVLDLMATSNIQTQAENQVKAAVYPNPVSDVLHIDLPYGNSNMVTTLSLFDAQGCLVKNIKTTQTDNTINVSDLSDGIYVLKVNAMNIRKTFKILVNH